MNKKLLAAAIAGAFVAPAAFADTSNVTIYGSASISIDSVSGKSTATTESNAAIGTSDKEGRWRVSSNNSYLGFKGTEDLGNDLSAIWQLEYSIDFTRQNQSDVSSSDTVYKSGGVGVISGRNSFVGLAGKSWGSVTAGLQDTPLKTSTGPLDVFKDTMADYRTLFTTNASSIRAQNSVMYSSPSMGGFSAKLMTAAKNEAGNGTYANGHLYSMNGTYANGPIFATLAYENNKQQFTVSTDNAKQTTWRAGFGYNFGPAKVGLGYESEKVSGTTTTNSYTEKKHSWYLSGAYSITKAATLKAAYTRVSDCKTNNTNVSAATAMTVSEGVATGGAFCGAYGADTGAKQWAFGADYDLSKRTKLYALYTQVDNDSNTSSYGLDGGATGIQSVSVAGNGNKARGFSVGVVHSF